MSFSVNRLLRENIARLTPYSSARDEYDGEDAIFLDANENPFESDVNRYPDPYQRKLKSIISDIYGRPASNIFLGNGSDEGIDLLFRAFCEPGKDNVISIHPSYGMYQVCADIQNIEVRRVLLNSDFSLDIQSVRDSVDERSKLIFLCSPNNPTANLLSKEDIRQLLSGFNGLVILDEAYIDFAPGMSMLDELDEYKNLCILRTLSKAWGMAGIRMGMVFADKEITGILSKIKYPYNLNRLSQQYAMEMLKKKQEKDNWVQTILDERKILKEELTKFSFVEKIYTSDANFLLVKTRNPKKLYNFLAEDQIIVRDRSNLPLCEGCLRITVGNPPENKALLKRLSEYKN